VIRAQNAGSIPDGITMTLEMRGDGQQQPKITRENDACKSLKTSLVNNEDGCRLKHDVEVIQYQPKRDEWARHAHADK
jgi:hypothetical protein